MSPSQEPDAEPQPEPDHTLMVGGFGRCEGHLHRVGVEKKRPNLFHVAQLKEQVLMKGNGDVTIQAWSRDTGRGPRIGSAAPNGLRPGRREWSVGVGTGTRGPLGSVLNLAELPDSLHNEVNKF